MLSTAARKALPSIPARRKRIRFLVPASISGRARGYIVAVPSRHISGRAYAWSVDHHPADTPIAEAPAWLLAKLAPMPSRQAEAPHLPQPHQNWLKLTREPVTEYRDLACARFCGYLVCHLIPWSHSTSCSGGTISSAGRRSRPPRCIVSGAASSTATPNASTPKRRTMRDADDVEAIRNARASHRWANRDEPAEDAAPKLVRISLARYDTEPIPEREWGVRDRFPRRNVALLSGEGAIGKSVLFLQLGIAHVLGRDWLRSLPERGRSSSSTAKTRKPNWCADYSRSSKATTRALATSQTTCTSSPWSTAETTRYWRGLDRSGRIVPTPLFHELMAEVREIQPICTVIDNVADVFGGSEIDRSQVRQFVALMRQIAIGANGYVIMSAHPSLTGIASKSGLSGSTQWHNSVRARAYMHTRRRPAMTRTGSRRVHEVELQRAGRANRIAMGERPVRADPGAERAGAGGAACGGRCAVPGIARQMDGQGREPQPKAERQQLRSDAVCRDRGEQGSKVYR